MGAWVNAIRILILAGFLAWTSAPAHAGNADTCAQALSPAATFEDLQDKITRCQLNSVESVLPVLSAKHRANYVLMHHSLSLQQATPENPRVILYGEDAKLILAFNGDPQLRGYDSIELMQYRDQTASFEFHRIEFGATGATISPANPALCLTCHRADPRPNFATYPLWPGAYGGEDDLIFREPPDTSPKQSEDAKSYARFLALSKRQSGRYRFLSDRPTAELPNAAFSGAIQALNFQRIARIVADMETLIPFRYALLGAVACYYSDSHADLEAFLPTTVRASFKTSLAQLEADTSKVNRLSFLSRVRDLQKIYPQAPEGERVQTLAEVDAQADAAPAVTDLLSARLRWIVENVGGQMSDWSLVLTGPNFDFENGYVGIEDLASPLADRLLTSADDQLLKLQLEHSAQDQREEICAELERKSLAVLETR